MFRSLPMVSGGRGPRFLRHTGIAAPLLLRDVQSENPEFVLNTEPFRSASILLASEGFGAGPAAESAIVRLMAFGVRAVAAPGFGPAFHITCSASGMLPMILGEEVIREVADRVLLNPGAELTVELERQVIEYPGMEPIPFGVDLRVRNKLLLGLTDLDEMLNHTENAERFRIQDRDRRPWIYDRR